MNLSCLTWASQVVLVVKSPPANAKDMGSIPGVGNGKPHQYSCLGNSMDRGSGLQSMGSHKSWTQLSY